MAPPLAGRPPFATDEPDSIYETPAPIRRIRQPAPPNPNDRSSAYDMYDNYLNDPAKNRQSGAGALGLGLLNGSLDDEDDDDEPSPKRQPPQPQPTSKNAMLAAAVTGVGRRASPSPPPQYNASLRSNIPPPQPSNPAPPPTILALRPGIAAPRPGYAAPIAALNLARPEPAANPVMPMGGMPGYRQPGPPMMQNPFNPPLQNPFSPHPQQGRMQNPFQPPRPNYSSPSPMPVSSTPHPLEPPVTPITPVFARPAKEIKFDEKPIMRGKTEDTMLPSRGQRRDDFWRRFSMVVHEQERPNAQKRSMWLRRTQNGIKRMSRWVWLVGILLILLAAGAAALGWYISHNDTSQTQPGIVGGNAGATAGPATTSKPPASLRSSLHVSPTNTVARREFAEPLHTPAPLIPHDIGIGSHSSRKRHLNRLH